MIQNRKIKKSTLIIIGILILSIISNPIKNDLKDYISANEWENIHVGRTGYFAIFSTFTINYEAYEQSPKFNDIKDMYSYKASYIGFFKNFIKIKEEKTYLYGIKK